MMSLLLQIPPAFALFSHQFFFSASLYPKFKRSTYEWVSLLFPIVFIHLVVHLLSRHIIVSGPLCALGDHSCGGGGWGCDSRVGGAVGAVDAGAGVLAVAAEQAGVPGPQDGPGGAAVWPRPGLRRVGEGQCGGVDDAVVPHQRDGHLDGLPHPAPALTEGWDVGHHTQHALRTPAGCGEKIPHKDVVKKSNNTNSIVAQNQNNCTILMMEKSGM